MTRLDKIMEQRLENERQGALLAVYGGLESGVAHAGGILVGMSVRFSEGDCLITLKADFPAGRMVGFVGGENFADTLRRAAGDAVRDNVKWREDKWRDNGGWPAEKG